MNTTFPKLVFGIYPGGAAGADSGIVDGTPGDSGKIEGCLAELQGNARPFVVRCYESPKGPPTPLNFEQYLHSGRLLDLVILYQSTSGDVAEFVRRACELTRRHAEHLYSVQITEEANFTQGPDVVDGPYPNVKEALVEGVVSVKEMLNQAGHSDVRVGFNSTPTFGPAASFWAELQRIGGNDFSSSVDYVGLDFFPDVFRRTASDGEPGDLRRSALAVLECMRNDWMPAAGIGPDIPIHIAEHGWPTAPDRNVDRQAEVIEAIVRLVHENRERLNIARYTLFDLRDAESSSPALADNIFYHFGITREDYSPKLSYYTFKKLVSELG